MLMETLARQFLEAYIASFSDRTVYTKNFPEEMKASEVDEEGWISWKPLKGNLEEQEYHKIEKAFNVLYPRSFIQWHQQYYFLDADCAILRLPISNPREPLKELRQQLDWPVAAQLIALQIYPFGDGGNDIGPLVFDGREPMPDNEFPIRVFDHEYDDLDGLSPIIFSSFTKLLECLTHFLQHGSANAVAGFFRIDPEGAGKTGRDYWKNWMG